MKPTVRTVREGAMRVVAWLDDRVVASGREYSGGGPPLAVRAQQAVVRQPAIGHRLEARVQADPVALRHERRRLRQETKRHPDRQHHPEHRRRVHRDPEQRNDGERAHQ